MKKDAQDMPGAMRGGASSPRMGGSREYPEYLRVSVRISCDTRAEHRVGGSRVYSEYLMVSVRISCDTRAEPRVHSERRGDDEATSGRGDRGPARLDDMVSA